MNNKLFALLTIGALAVAAPNAKAQYGYNPFEIGGSGGIAFPTGDLSDGANTGYNIALAVGYRPQFTPFAIRGEAAWNQFGESSGSGNFNIPSFTANVEVGLPLGMSFSPYVIGGAGLYRPNFDFNGGGSTQAENHFGWNVGGGVKIPLSTSFTTFVEARYNSVSVNGATLSFVPLTVGLMF
ncbi:MAG TPA: outer membrane beta-barrel protein [Gemmatimonadaceae bacterium]|nr:outer membrane beta-barrel protein [Gemmatimonadaceae bacterium]